MTYEANNVVLLYSLVDALGFSFRFDEVTCRITGSTEITFPGTDFSVTAKVVASYYNTRQKKAGVLYRLSGDLLILVGAAKTGTNICFVIIDEKPIREKTSGVFSGALSPKIGSKKFWNKIKPGFVKMYTYSPEGWQLLEGEEVDSAISLFFGGSHTKAGGA